ncbi:hypothetical protein NL676_019375 [Syzygium grande]|nr:hypothetical protein NL676_019375 [Syzygium grande]
MEDRNRKLSSEDKETWRQALKNVGGISGKESKTYSGDGALIQAVVHEVVVRLKTRRRPVTEDLVGMEDQIAAINKLLDIGPGGVWLIGIYGMGGIGKTTLANIIFNQLYSQFGKNCCFLEGIKEGAQVEALQFRSLSDRITVTSEEIKRFPHIRFLSLSDVNCRGDFTGCLSELRWIDLYYYLDQRLEATNLLHLQNAIVVNLTGLQFTDDVFKGLIKVRRFPS